MAGGKETPRQRMVGLMYLVLTALLALQVSNAVLEKFIFIDEALRRSVQQSRDGNDKVLTAIKAKVAEQGSVGEDVAIMKRAEAARATTSAVLDEVHKIRQGLIDWTGGTDPKTGEYMGAKDYDKVMTFMIGAGEVRDGKAFTMKSKLNEYVEQMKKLDTALLRDKSIGPIALDAKDIPMYAKSDDHKLKDFADLNFGHTPLVAALAVISQYETEVAKVETKAMEHFQSQLGKVIIKFDQIFASYTAESNMVAAGTKYKATMFLTASSSSITPRMSSTAGGVKVEGSKGTLEFTASAGAYGADGTSEKSWKGSISVKTTRGTDTTFEVEAKYKVVKPVVQVQAGNVSAMYFNCANDINIQVPALGTNYDPSFSADGAEIIRGAQKGAITVVPTAPKDGKISIVVKSGGNVISPGEVFKVRQLPKPDVQVFNGSKPIDQKVGGACPGSLSAKALAEASIRDAIPRDARYKVVEWEVTLARGSKPAAPPKRVTGDDVNLSDFRTAARPGDRIVIEVKKVMRMNFKNQTEDVKVGTVIFTYPITQ